MIRLSATSIKDYVECPQRFWYRTHRKETAEPSKYAVFGQIVHEAIEKFDEPGPAVKWSEAEWDERSMGTFGPKFGKKPPRDFARYLGNYFYTVEPKLKAEKIDKAEFFFRVAWKNWDGNKPVEIVGKMDRVIDDKIYDWKTGTRKPSDLTIQDIQFYVYHWAYNEIFGEAPEVYYGFLYKPEIFRVDIKPKLLNDDLPKIVNRLLDDIDRPPYRVFGYQCNSCFYKRICWRDADDRPNLEF